jgi:hypothetical protein
MCITPSTVRLRSKLINFVHMVRFAMLSLCGLYSDDCKDDL